MQEQKNKKGFNKELPRLKIDLNKLCKRYIELDGAYGTYRLLSKEFGCSDTAIIKAVRKLKLDKKIYTGLDKNKPPRRAIIKPEERKQTAEILAFNKEVLVDYEKKFKKLLKTIKNDPKNITNLLKLLIEEYIKAVSLLGLSFKGKPNQLVDFVNNDIRFENINKAFDLYDKILAKQRNPNYRIPETVDGQEEEKEDKIEINFHGDKKEAVA